jgi:sortase A
LGSVTEQVAEQDEQSSPAATVEGSAFERWRERRRNRVSKWDRPPEPHDWRFYVGGLGKILIALGLLLFGFVAYQLWGTGIETARAQNQLESEFEELIAANDATTTPEVTVTAPADTAPVTTSPETTPDTTGAPTTEPSEPTPSTAPPTTAPRVVEQDIPPIARGQALAKLEIPKIGKEGADALYVLPGIDREDLKKGPGHYPDTPLPGQLGNSAIAGHRTTFGEPFRHIDELKEGDEIIVTMFTGDRFVYEVTETVVVSPDDYYVVTTTDPTVAELTLTSCHPVYSARQRIAVHARLKPDDSAPIGQPTFYDTETDTEASEQTATDDAGSEAVSAEDDPTVGASETSDTRDTSDTSDVEPSVDEATSEGSEEPEEGSEEAEESSDTGEAIAPSPVPPSADVQDAFNEGWFQDSGAWPQIALWGAALILIAIGVRLISRKTRHDSIGILCGAIPFLICLYFFYQNVNRLLPPGF